MSLQIKCCSGSILTVFTEIPQCFMFTFNMSLQRTCCSGSILTVFTEIPHCFMLTINMSLQRTSCSGNIFKVFTGISYFLLLTFNMFLPTYKQGTSDLQKVYIRPTKIVYPTYTAYSQCLQGYLTLLCLLSTCFLRLFTVVVSYSHVYRDISHPRV